MQWRQIFYNMLHISCLNANLISRLIEVKSVKYVTVCVELRTAMCSRGKNRRSSSLRVLFSKLLVKYINKCWRCMRNCSEICPRQVKQAQTSRSPQTKTASTQVSRIRVSQDHAQSRCAMCLPEQNAWGPALCVSNSICASVYVGVRRSAQVCQANMCPQL